MHDRLYIIKDSERKNLHPESLKFFNDYSEYAGNTESY